MYTAIFNEIVDIMHHDYAGYKDKEGWDTPEKYSDEVKSLDEKGGDNAGDFVKIVQEYLLDFQDSHMYFDVIQSNVQKKYDVGFTVRRYKHKLYVTSVGKADRFTPGDAIVSLDSIPVSALVTRHKREFMQNIAEREDWKRILPRYSSCEVMKADGTKRSMELNKHEKKYAPEYSISRMNAHTLHMKLTDFMNQDAVDQLLKDHEKELNETSNLIIDVCVNYGGSDDAYNNILPYLMDEGTKSYPLFEDYAMKANYTTRNCELLIADVREKEKSITEKRLLAMIPGYIKELQGNKGKGFITTNLNECEQITGKKYPKQIIVLSDVYCGSAGDFFVNTCRYSPKTTIVGRPTAGLNDYSNLIRKTWGGVFELLYPLTRLNAIDTRGHKTDGIQPDIYIPWTPEHIGRDIELEKALELLDVT